MVNPLAGENMAQDKVTKMTSDGAFKSNLNKAQLNNK